MTIEPFPAVRRRADGDEPGEADVRRVDKRTSRRQNSKRAPNSIIFTCKKKKLFKTIGLKNGNKHFFKSYVQSKQS